MCASIHVEPVRTPRIRKLNILLTNALVFHSFLHSKQAVIFPKCKMVPAMSCGGLPIFSASMPRSSE